MWGWCEGASGPHPEAPWAALGLGLLGGLRYSSSPPHIPLFWRGGPGYEEAPLRRPLSGGQGAGPEEARFACVRGLLGPGRGGELEGNI